MEEKWFWIPDSEECWKPAKLIDHGKTISVFENSLGELIKVKSYIFPQLSPLHLSSIQNDFPNLVELEEFCEGAILYQIRNRFKQDKIYTNIGSILIAVNPFKLLPVCFSLLV